MAETARAPFPTPLATNEITATAGMTQVMAASSVYGITAAWAPIGTNASWSVYNRGTGSVSLRWDGISDAVSADPGSFTLPNGASVTGIQARRITAAADATGCTIAIVVQPGAYR